MSCDDAADATVRRDTRRLIVHQIGGASRTSFPEQTKKLLDLKRAITGFLQELLATQAAIESASESYFDGWALLFKEEAEQLASVIVEFEALAEDYSLLASAFQKVRALDQRKPRRTSFEIDLESVGTRADKLGEKLLEVIIAGAKAKTLRAIGDLVAGDALWDACGKDIIAFFDQKKRIPGRPKSQPSGAKHLAPPEPKRDLFDSLMAQVQRT